MRRRKWKKKLFFPETRCDCQKSIVDLDSALKMRLLKVNKKDQNMFI